MSKNEFDPYREALVVEHTTEWPADFSDWDARQRAEFASRLHAQPQQAEQLEYVRQHTGFCRKITVTAADVQRIAS